MEHPMRALKRISRDENGAVAMLFALAFIPLIGFVGAALDYARATQAQSRLQASLDAAVLIGARDQLGLTNAQLTDRIRQAVIANMGTKSPINASDITVTKVDKTLVVSAKTDVQTVVMGLLGQDSMEVRGTASASWGTNEIEIALALDNTGSMGWSNKIQELKKALCGNQDCSNPSPSTGFISIMKNAATSDGQIRISLVPFDTTVRMPQNVQDAVAADVPFAGSMSGAGPGYCSSGHVTDDAQRVSFFRFANRDKDTIASNRNAANNNVGNGCGVGRVTPTTWQGCVWDRDQAGDKDAKDNGIVLNDFTTLHPAVNCRSNTLARILPLTDVRTNSAMLIAAMATMQPSGNTNLTPGVAWGVATLTNAAPFTEGKVPDPRLRKFMILLTDGENTENRQTTNSNAIDTRALTACTNAKALGITIYSVRVIDGDAALLRACASNPSMYYEVANASQLTPVFETIANEIGSIRLTN